MNAVLAGSTIARSTAAAADSQESIVAGREALDQWWGHPWYDPATDGVRRLEIPEPVDWSWLRDWVPDLSWIGDWIRSWWPSWAPGFGWPDTLLGWLAWSGLILALALTAYLLIRAYLRRRDRGVESGRGRISARGDDDSDRVEALPFPVQNARGNLLEEARRYYQQGDYAQAIVYLFSFQLVRLDKGQIIRLTTGKTNRQYLREVGPRPALQRLLQQTMVAFEDVFFGNRPLDRPGFEACWSRLDEFESLAAQGTS
ncbi:MAG: DUF4129 domain-containing protein [Pirellulales bacterium]|nr:DUF4129 domain-containing protein [Pirellulales bacterium]